MCNIIKKADLLIIVISEAQANNYLYCPLSCTLRVHERWLYESGRADCARFLVKRNKTIDFEVISVYNILI